jgi:hypothetical protein
MRPPKAERFRRRPAEPQYMGSTPIPGSRLRVRLPHYLGASSPLNFDEPRMHLDPHGTKKKLERAIQALHENGEMSDTEKKRLPEYDQLLSEGSQRETTPSLSRKLATHSMSTGQNHFDEPRRKISSRLCPCSKSLALRELDRLGRSYIAGVDSHLRSHLDVAPAGLKASIAS